MPTSTMGAAARAPPLYSSTMKRGGSSLPLATARRHPIFRRLICGPSNTFTLMDLVVAASVFAAAAR